MAKAAFSKKGAIFDSKLNSNLRKKPVKCHVLSTAVRWAEN
jgi:hypothetical protein